MFVIFYLDFLFATWWTWSLGPEPPLTMIYDVFAASLILPCFGLKCVEACLGARGGDLDRPHENIGTGEDTLIPSPSLNLHPSMREATYLLGESFARETEWQSFRRSLCFSRCYVMRLKTRRPAQRKDRAFADQNGLIAFGLRLPLVGVAAVSDVANVDAIILQGCVYCRTGPFVLIVWKEQGSVYC